MRRRFFLPIFSHKKTEGRRRPSVLVSILDLDFTVRSTIYGLELYSTLTSFEHSCVPRLHTL